MKNVKEIKEAAKWHFWWVDVDYSQWVDVDYSNYRESDAKQKINWVSSLHQYYLMHTVFWCFFKILSIMYIVMHN